MAGQRRSGTTALSNLLGTALALLLAGCGAVGDGATAGVASTATASKNLAASPVIPATPTTRTAPLPSTAPPSTPPDGWTVVHGRDTSMAVPPGWLSVKQQLRDPGLRAEVDDTLASLPEAILLDVDSSMLDTMDILVVDGATVDAPVRTMAAVTTGSRYDFPTLDDLAAELPETMAEVFGPDAKAEVGRIVVDGVDLVTMDLTTTIAGLSGGTRQYYRIDGETMVIVSVTFAPGADDRDRWDRMAATAVATSEF